MLSAYLMYNVILSFNLSGQPFFVIVQRVILIFICMCYSGDELLIDREYALMYNVHVCRSVGLFYYYKHD